MTAETKHTAGPWIHEGHGEITGIENDPDNGCVVCSVYLRTVQGRHEANARLIAALEALNEINNWLVCACIASPEDMARSFPHMQQIAEFAIAKATGETGETQ